MRSARVILVGFVLFVMITAGFSGAIASGLAPRPLNVVKVETAAPSDPSIKMLRIPLTFGDISSVEQDGYAILSVAGASGTMHQADAPMLPMYSQMLQFPVNTRIVSVTLEGASHSRTWTDLRVMPAPKAVPLIDGTIIPGLRQGLVYFEPVLFPENDLDQMVTTGQGDWGGIEAHLFVKVFPVQYNPVTSVIVKLDSADLVVKYIPPVDGARPMASRAHYDLLVLHPDAYGNGTLPYIQHKEAMGWKIKNASLSEIYSSAIFNVTKGRDNQEKIKLFIKQAMENWTITHVLIVGDQDKFPIRRAYIPDIDGSATPTDLYYEDIYKGGTQTLSDWNSDNDAYWAESTGSNKNADNCDLDPDVAVGRWPVGSVTELDNVVAKTISYDENITKPDAYDWFRNVTLVGSNTFTLGGHGDTSGVAEGEYTEDYNTQWLGGFNVNKFYETKGTLNTANVKKSLDAGVGMMGFADHGSTGGVVYAAGQIGLVNSGAQTSTNGHKLPLSVMDACQTHQLDTEESIGEYLILNPNGGAIGSIGATRIAYGMFGTWHIAANSGFIDVHIFKEHQNATIMPPLMLDKAKRDYLNEVGLWDYADFKTQVQYIYLGDPIVFIGGPGIKVEPANNPMSLAPNESGKFLVGLNNSGLVTDDLTLNISGGNMSYSLSTYSMHMKADSMTYITVGVTVDADALADTKDNVTLTVTPKSTTIPVITNLTTIVKAVRDVRFGATGTPIKVMPGHQFKVDYSIDNKGNAVENTTVVLQGGSGDFTVLATKAGILTAAYKRTDGNLTVLVPEGTLADTYLLQLTLTTVSGVSKTFIISVEVGEQDGLETHLINVAQTFNADRTADYQVYIENAGNHRERFDLSLAVKDPKWQDQVSWDLPGTVILGPYENVTEAFQLRAAARAPAGDATLGLTVASTAAGGPHETLDLTATVLPVSSIDLLALQKQGDVKQGQSVKLELVVISGSNFDEQVALTFDGAPKEWTVTKDVDTLALPVYASGHFNITFSVPKKFKAGDYPIKVTAEGNASEAQADLVVTVLKGRAVGLSFDKKEFSGYPGQKANIKVTIENQGNSEDLLVLGVDDITVPFECALASSTVTVGAWGKAEVMMTVTIPEGTPAKDGTVRLKLRSANDATAVATETLTLHSLFKANPSLSVHSDQASTDYVGQTGTFTVFLVNDGNVDQTVNIVSNGTTNWNVQYPANVTLKPGESKDVVVTYGIPSNAKPGDYPVDLTLNSSSGGWNVDHTVTVRKVPNSSSGSAGASSVLPYLAIIIILVVVVCILLVMYALKARSRRREEELMAQPPAAPPAVPPAATTAPAPEPVKAPVVDAGPKPAAPEPVKEPPAKVAPAPPPAALKTLGGGPPPKEEPKTAPMPSTPPATPEPTKPKSADEAIDQLLKDLE